MALCQRQCRSPARTRSGVSRPETRCDRYRRTEATQTAKGATANIPIVTTGATDPVGSGIMETLAHPGGNVTGLSLDASGLGGKRLEILKETFPKLTRTAVLYIRASPSSETILAETKQAARLLKVDLLPVAVDAVSELDRAFNMMSKEHAEAVPKIT